MRTSKPGVRRSALARSRFDSAHPYDDGANPVNYDEIRRFASEELAPIARRLQGVKSPQGGSEDCPEEAPGR